MATAWPIEMDVDPATGWPICLGYCGLPVDPDELVLGLCAACRNQHPITGQHLCECGRTVDVPAREDFPDWSCPTCGKDDGGQICIRCGEVSPALLAASFCPDCQERAAALGEMRRRVREGRCCDCEQPLEKPGDRDDWYCPACKRFSAAVVAAREESRAGQRPR